MEKEQKKQQTEQEEKRAFEPFLLAKNEPAKNDLIFNVRQFFKMVQEIKAKLDEKGIKSNEEIITDCLTMHRRTDGEGRDFVYVFDNSEHLDEELTRQLKEETEGLKSRIIRDNITSTMKQAAEVLKNEILAIRATFDEVQYNKETYRKFLSFDESGEITLISDLEEIAEQESGYWVTTESQNEAYEAHKNAANAITDFLNHFPKSVWPSTTAEVGNLFKMGDNGEFAPQFINYANYIN